LTYRDAEQIARDDAAAKRRAVRVWKYGERERGDGIETDEAGRWLRAHDPEAGEAAPIRAPRDRPETKARREGGGARACGRDEQRRRGSRLASSERPARSRKRSHSVKPLAPNPSCPHRWATIAALGGRVTHLFCIDCKARRKR